MSEPAIGDAAHPSSALDWLPILSRLSLTGTDLAHIEGRARLAGVPFQAELLASGQVEERALYRELATELGLPFRSQINPDGLVMRDWQGLAALRNRGGPGIASYVADGERIAVLVAPERLDIGAMRVFMRRYPSITKRMTVVPPSVLRKALQIRFNPAIMDVAVNRLSGSMSQFSARTVLNAPQGAVLGALSVALAVALALAPGKTLIGLHVLCSTAFLFCVALRVAVSRWVSAPPAANLQAIRPADMPVYSVLVALYKEAEMIPDLLVALGRIVWPRVKLEVKLVCESDDTETLEAIRAQELRPFIEVIEVPARAPRTKPKALAYALPLTTGEIVALYDAEDRPHPFQLVEAWQRLRRGGDNLGCVQAPLVVSNRRKGWIAWMFALEYAALFRGILPWLARHGLVVPLGGTSNHFRRQALEACGGWDPYNVTEDADLGIRLHRLGYRTDVIANPTYEDAPNDWNTWLPQRTRWFKGWLQTWLVHMRQPLRLYAELGARSFLVMQVLFAGMFFSALAYSVFLATALSVFVYFVFAGIPDIEFSILIITDIVNIVLGHLAFLTIGWATLSGVERSGFWKMAPATPLYWAMISAAAWRGLWQLYQRPHHWEKTPHRPAAVNRR